MGRCNVNVRITGVDDVLKRAGKRGAVALIKQIDETVERSVRKMANEAAGNAPYDSGKLSGSIPPSVDKVEEMSWEFGSDVEYATRQEYEHSSKKGFLRKAVWNNRESLRNEVKGVIRDV